MVSTAVRTSTGGERQKKIREWGREEVKRESEHPWGTSERFLRNTRAKGYLGN